jgi:hypothetical protein
MGLWISDAKMVASDRPRDRTELGKAIVSKDTPTPLALLNGLLGAGFAKSRLQIRDNK